MTGRRPIRSTSPGGPRGRSRATRTGALSAGALVACASLAVGCGVVPGATGGSGDDGPITVMTWAPQDTGATNKPGMPALAQAYARSVNAQGGLGGRKLNVLTCNDHNDSVTAAKCARRAVKEDVVAVVGSYSQHADSFFPVLEGARIPYIGGYGLTNTEFTSPLSYPVNGGQPALLAGLGRALADSCGPVTLVRPDTIAGDQLAPLLDSGLVSGGHERAHDQRAAEDATSYDDQVGQALAREGGGAGKPGCVVPVLGDRTGTFMDSFRRAREDHPGVRTATVLGSVDQTTVNASGGASGPYEGAYVTGWYPAVGDPAWDGLKKLIKEQAFGDNDVDAADAGVQTTWIAYTVFKQVVESLGDGEVSADTVRRALDDGLEAGTGGLTPDLRWTFADKLASVGFPRLVNAEVTLQVVREGRLVSAREGAVDTTGTLRDADVT
ncbi:ABC transporter substrate-binding protein [Streptomyces sp. R1]|uniref:ABC transporter substrate-binding protein n=1 Tax=unclassified Streptomyces TaxID=2593676 RepID=UPI00052A3D30|nr:MULTISPECIES: ABC transporter substrate-binding protein [unclassified Streptomyces]AIV35867.1 lipoprotein [Streptomyces sp. CCM_MD2014]MCC8336700.1 ABC transporter substrate-binding protein [Streptomyces sp. R1]